MAAPARSGDERKRDALARLEDEGADTWVATASAEGVAHLVPLSYAWDGRRIVIAAQPTSPTVRNIRVSRRARLGFGPTRDVVLVDAELEDVKDSSGVPVDVAAAYARQAGWDPRREREPYVFLFLRPRRVQAWREANELDGRTLMREGVWLF